MDNRGGVSAPEFVIQARNQAGAALVIQFYNRMCNCSVASAASTAAATRFSRNPTCCSFVAGSFGPTTIRVAGATRWISPNRQNRVTSVRGATAKETIRKKAIRGRTREPSNKPK